ncbi:MAG: ribonuclease P protein component [SAR324 cluster bacterium]|nr:ribonuclease P protein component [SAR324 cluster bacterium]
MSRPGGLPKSSRLRLKKDIGEVFRQGRYHRLGILQAKSLPTGRAESRFMISVRKSVGAAPERNRIKRVLREAVRLNRWRLRTPHDVCLFVTARPHQRVRLSVVERDLQNLFDRLSGSGHVLLSDG